MTDEPLFNSTHVALTFAFEYAGQQSPRTPMTSLMRTENIGSGKGLSGLDGAAQAGFILAEVCRLSDDQHNIIVARYGRVTHECRGAVRMRQAMNGRLQSMRYLIAWN